MSDLLPDDPAMLLLNQYIDKRVEEAVSSAVSKFEQDALSRMQAQILELEQMLEKLKEEVHDEVHNADTSDDDLDNDSSDSDGTGSDLEVVETRKWGKSYGESSGSKKNTKKKKKNDSDDEKASKKPKTSAVKKKSAQPKKKGPGRPLGSKNSTTAKQKLMDENKALKKKLDELQGGAKS